MVEKKKVILSFCEILVFSYSVSLLFFKLFPQSRCVTLFVLFAVFVFGVAFSSSIYLVFQKYGFIKVKSKFFFDKKDVKKSLFIVFSLLLGCYSSLLSEKVEKNIFFISEEKISKIEGELLSDLKAFGEDNKISQIKILYVEDDCLNRFSSKGIISAVFPNNFLLGANSLILGSGSKVILNGKFNSKKNLFKVEKVESVGWTSKINKWRCSIRSLIGRILRDWGECGGLLYALLTSSREYMSKDLSDAFIHSGCAHVIALSGMHASLLCGFACLIWSFLAGKKKSLLFGICFVCFFCWFAGTSPSLRRSFFMLLIGAIGVYSGFSIPLLPLLMMSFFMQTYFFPSDYQMPSFWLSYSGVLGLSLFSKPLEYLFKPFVPQGLASSLSSSVSAQLTTSCFSVYYFGLLVPAGVFASIPICFLIVPFMVVGSITLLLEFILFSFSPFLIPSELSIKIIETPIHLIFEIIRKILIFFQKIPVIKFQPAENSFFGTGITTLFCFIMATALVAFYNKKIKRSCVIDEFTRL